MVKRKAETNTKNAQLVLGVFCVSRVRHALLYEALRTTGKRLPNTKTRGIDAASVLYSAFPETEVHAKRIAEIAVFGKIG